MAITFYDADSAQGPSHESSPKSQQSRSHGKSTQTAVNSSHRDTCEAKCVLRKSSMLSSQDRTLLSKERHSTKPYREPSPTSASHSVAFATRSIVKTMRVQNAFTSSSSSSTSSSGALTPDSSSGTEDASGSVFHANLNAYPHYDLPAPRDPSSSANADSSSSTGDVPFPASHPDTTIASRIFHRLAMSNVNSPAHSHGDPLEPTPSPGSSSSVHADSSSHTQQLATIRDEEETQDVVVEDVLGDSGTLEEGQLEGQEPPVPGSFDEGLDYTDEDQVFAFYINVEKCEC